MRLLDSNSDIDMKEAVALVTGAASGLGKATVQHLLKHGFKVAMLDLPSSNGAFLSKLINRNCLYIPANITVDEEIKNGVSKIKDKFGHLNAVINCAGISFNCKTFSFNKENMNHKSSVKLDLKKVLAVNVVGTLNVIRHALDLVTQNEKDESECRGVVINTSSFSSFEPQFGQGFDAMSSGAVNSATISLAKDYASDGIRFVTIAPGIFRTPLVISHMNELNVEIYEKMVQLPARLGIPEEFAALVLHIIHNTYLNGVIIRLDGALRMPP
ncbi:oxidoreductase, short chain dehydrogenase/reductase family protein [Brugia malayi]|uniref:Bm3231 n=1 Tax=Brugia malayi TaxID=6279 RepID=A0A0H5SAX6_BRUMA|nr:oxidoreductase, short chain dehydrogenase/reductase family protein [Brugia malayi]CRZ25814.1 Bm3231 [Brugia malayi]VIO86174.1 oxidoreductase, short chain dehydrogenase/reductase family protein [Brugia malayi]